MAVEFESSLADEAFRAYREATPSATALAALLAIKGQFDEELKLLEEAGAPPMGDAEKTMNWIKAGIVAVKWLTGEYDKPEKSPFQQSKIHRMAGDANLTSPKDRWQKRVDSLREAIADVQKQIDKIMYE